jgi:hypothetical protein
MRVCDCNAATLSHLRRQVSTLSAGLPMAVGHTANAMRCVDGSRVLAVAAVSCRL